MSYNIIHFALHVLVMFIQQSSERELLVSLFCAYQQLFNFISHMMNTTDESFPEEYANETFTWSITAVVVAILVILTLVIVICILKKTPERDLEVTRVGGAGGARTLRGRAVAYYNKYWKVTDPDAPKFDSTRRDIKKYNFGTLWTKAEREMTEEDETYSLPDNTTIATVT